MQILTINNNYNIYVFNIISDNNFIKSSFSFSNTKYPDLNDFLIKSTLKPLIFTLTRESFEGIIEQYSSAWQNKTAKDFDNIDIILNKNIYGFNNNDIISLKMDLKEYIASTTYGQLVIRKIK